MQHHSSNALTVLLCSVLFTGLYASDEPSTTLSSIIDTTISCVHWIACPYCLLDPDRMLCKFQAALEKNDTKMIVHIIRRRGFSPNQQILDGSLPLIYVAKKAYVESVEQLLKLGSDVNSQMRGTMSNDYPSSLIAVCAAAKLPPERVFLTVKVLLDHGADPERNCIMLTEEEKAEFNKLHDQYQKDPSKEEQILAQIPQYWFSPRTALDFARKNKYTAAANIIIKALSEQRKKGKKTNDMPNEYQADDSF